MAKSAAKVLIVFAHQSSGSFNAVAKDTAVEVLTAQGCIVETSDLYAIAHKAAARAEAIKRHFNSTEKLSCLDLSKLSLEQTFISDEIAKEQSKLAEADLVIFQFPKYWCGVPGILKGWFDRVLANGLDFSQDEPFTLETFKGKKAMLSLTNGCRTPMPRTDGDMNVTLWPLQNGILHYCGFRVLATQVFWVPDSATAEDHKNMMESWRTRLQGLLEEEPLSFTPLDHLDEKTSQLKPDVHENGASK